MKFAVMGRRTGEGFSFFGNDITILDMKWKFSTDGYFGNYQ
jgi:hypothetical protein